MRDRSIIFIVDESNIDYCDGIHCDDDRSDCDCEYQLPENYFNFSKMNSIVLKMR